MIIECLTAQTVANERVIPADALREFSKRRALKHNLVAEVRASCEGNGCETCGNMTLVRNGICLKCEMCGGTTGCFQAR